MANISLDKKLSDLERIFGIATAKDSIGYTILRDNIDSKYFPKEWSTQLIKGPMKNFLINEDTISIEFQNGFLLISAINQSTIFLKWSLQPERNESRGNYRFDVTVKNGELILGLGDLKIIIADDKMDYFLKNEFLRTDFFPSIGSKNILVSEIRENSIINGTGERALPLDLRGNKVMLWNHDANGSYGPGDDPLYINIPILLDIYNDKGYYIFFNNPAKGEMDICSESKNIVKVEFSGGLLDYYITFGNMKDVISNMSNIIGKPLLPPKWALGYHQSRYSYNSQSELETLFKKFQEMNLPISAIHLDIDYMDGYRVFTLDEKRFPDLKKFADKLKEKGVRIVAILDPGVKWDNKFQIYKEGIDNNYFIKDPEGNVIRGPVWPGNSAFPDFSDEKVRKWWSSKYSFFTEHGITGVWHDMNEPAIFVFWGDNSLPLTALQYDGYHYEIHNRYGLDMAKAGYIGVTQMNDGERPFILSRSGWAGIQKYAFVWTGDTESTWREIRQTIPTILNLGLSGIPFSGVDIGGFSGNPSEELFLRWFELSSLLPFFRNHSARNTKRREPWYFSKMAQDAIKKYLNLRYMLIPYFFSIAYESNSKGFPFIRPVHFEYPDLQSDETFFVGDFLYAMPVIRRGIRKVTGRLPEGRWYYFWDDSLCEGDVVINVPIDDLPLFIKEGSIIPMDRDGLEFHVYPGNLDEFSFYDDDSRIEPNYIKITFSMEGHEEGYALFWETEGTLMNWDDELKFVIHSNGQQKELTSKIGDKKLYFT